jgi:hypothetical protein
MAVNAADRAAVRAVTELLLDRLDADERSARQIAVASGVDPSTMSRWRHPDVAPRIGHAIAVGLTLGDRLVWDVPADWIGVDEARRSTPPTIEPWWHGQIRGGPLPPAVPAPAPLTSDYLAWLLGAEVRWWRLSVARRSLEDIAGRDAKAWTHFETGPDRSRFSGRKSRLMKSAPLGTVVHIGRHAGLSLTWERSDDPWRVRPWIIAGEPRRVRRSAPQKDEDRQRSLGVRRHP